MNYEDTGSIPAETGTIYSGRCRIQDESLAEKIARTGDASAQGGSWVFFPTLVSAIAANLTFKGTKKQHGEVQTGKIAGFERVANRTTVFVEWTDKPETTTLGTISDLVVHDNGTGSVALVWTAVPGAVSYQAQVDGVDSGASVDGQTNIIVLTGLDPGLQAFTVEASDGTSTTTSNSVNHTVT